jgi:hypothetical protein
MILAEFAVFGNGEGNGGEIRNSACGELSRAEGGIRNDENKGFSRGDAETRRGEKGIGIADFGELGSTELAEVSRTEAQRHREEKGRRMKPATSLARLSSPKSVESAEG